MAEHKTWPKAVEELLALHETFRRLGFSADELWVEFFPKQNNIAAFTVRHKDKEFSVIVARDQNLEELAKQWQAGLAWWNEEATDGEAYAVYAFSTISGKQVELITHLTERGLLKEGKAI